MSNIVNLIANNNYIVVNKSLINSIGIDASLLLGELASEYCYFNSLNSLISINNDYGYFYSTINNIENNIGLSRKRQDKAFSILKNLNIIDIKVKGNPPKRYIKIIEINLIKLFN